MQKLSDPELLNWAREILVALKSWTLAGEDERLAIQYNELGRVRFENSVPLYEVVRCLHILKGRVSGFVRGPCVCTERLRTLWSGGVGARHRTLL